LWVRKLAEYLVGIEASLKWIWVLGNGLALMTVGGFCAVLLVLSKLIA
jgi:hypothetical protein